MRKAARIHHLAMTVNVMEPAWIYLRVVRIGAGNILTARSRKEKFTNFLSPKKGTFAASG